MANTSGLFNTWAEKYDEYLPHFPVYQKIIKTTLENTSITPGSKVLDVGIGTGNISLSIFSKTPCKITGVDISPEMMKIAKEKADEMGTNIVFVNSSACSMELKDKFDLAVSAFAIHHLNENEKLETFRRICNALEDSGRFILSDVTIGVDGDIKSEKRLNHILDRWGYEARYALKYIGPEAVDIALSGLRGVFYRDGEYIETPEKLISMLKEAGFKLVKHEIPDKNIGYHVFICDKV